MIYDKFDPITAIPAYVKRPPSFRIVKQVFTKKQCDKIFHLVTQNGRFYSDSSNDGNAEIRYLRNDEAQWVYDKMAVAFAANNIWGFSLQAIFESLRVIRYKKGGYAGPHNDLDFDNGDTIAKLTAVIPLVPNEWKGGELLLGTNATRVSVPIGGMAIFPSFLMHQVTRVTKGQRIVLVGWAAGRPFV